MPQDPSRLDALEAHVAHQDAVIEELNEALIEQRKIIDALTREIEALRERAAAIEADARAGDRQDGEDERPPHW